MKRVAPRKAAPKQARPAQAEPVVDPDKDKALLDAIAAAMKDVA